MGTAISKLQDRIQSGKPIVVAELTPPQGANADAVRNAARSAAGKVHAVGVSDNRERVCMSALAAATIVAGEGLEPILHVVTRDRNRIALIADCLGAQALGLRNVLCTTGTHQTLGDYHASRNVFDIDSVQLLSAYADLQRGGQMVGEKALEGGPLCLGAVASPFSDPAELQLIKLEKKIQAGAAFVITQPVFDIARFEAWWAQVTARGLHQKAAFLAGVRPLADAHGAQELIAKRPRTMIPEALLNRLAAKADPAAQRAEGIAIAVETIGRLRKLPGLRGFEVCANGHFEAALEVIHASGLEVN